MQNCNNASVDLLAEVENRVLAHIVERFYAFIEESKDPGPADPAVQRIRKCE